MLENLNNLIHSGRNYLVAAEVDPAGMAELFFREPGSSQVTRESVSFAPFMTCTRFPVPCGLSYCTLFPFRSNVSSLLLI